MPSNSSKKDYDPADKVERMNRIFDQVVLPIIIFTVIMAVISAIIIKPESCVSGYADDLAPVEDVRTELDPYLMREVLLEDMAANRSIFEQGGYTIVETEQSGLVAYCQLDECTQIFDNVSDGSGGRYSAVMYEKDGLSVTVRIYSGTIFLVEASDGQQRLSAIFRDDRFATWTSGSDADAGAIFELISAQQLADLAERYEQKIISLVNSD